MALWTPRLIKPTSFVRANLAHPQARELAFFLHYVGRGTFFDAITGGADSEKQRQRPVCRLRQQWLRPRRLFRNQRYELQ